MVDAALITIGLVMVLASLELVRELFVHERQLRQLRRNIAQSSKEQLDGGFDIAPNTGEHSSPRKGLVMQAAPSLRRRTPLKHRDSVA